MKYLLLYNYEVSAPIDSVSGDVGDANEVSIIVYEVNM